MHLGNKYVISVLLGVLLVSFAAAVPHAEGRTYRAAVAQHSRPDWSVGDDVPAYKNQTLKSYSTLVEKASSAGGQIVVFPEFTFVPEAVMSCSHGTDPLRDFAVTIPAIGTDICDSGSPLKALACAAKAGHIYVAVNLVELDSDSEKLYNTEVVFSSTGLLAARYRKTHVFLESCFSIPSPVEHVTFKTDFGVTFGIFTCFDVAFDNPAVQLRKKYGVEHFVYSVAVPTIVGSFIPKTWSYIHSATILASNEALGRSSIYAHGSLLTASPSSTADDVVLADVPI